MATPDTAGTKRRAPPKTEPVKPGAAGGRGKKRQRQRQQAAVPVK